MCLCRFKSIDFDVLYVLYKHDKMLRVTIISNFVLYALHVRYKGTHAKLTSSPEDVTKVSILIRLQWKQFCKGGGIKELKGEFWYDCAWGHGIIYCQLLTINTCLYTCREAHFVKHFYFLCQDTLGPSDSNLVHKLILQYRIGNCFFLEFFACIWHFEYILIHLQFFTNTIQNIGFFLVYIVHFKSNISLFFKITSKFSMN